MKLTALPTLKPNRLPEGLKIPPTRLPTTPLGVTRVLRQREGRGRDSIPPEGQRGGGGGRSCTKHFPAQSASKLWGLKIAFLHTFFFLKIAQNVK